MSDYLQYLICYDTPDDKRRRKIVATLEETCERVQKSVFEGWLTTQQLQRIQRKLCWIIDKDLDNVRIYRFCHYCQRSIDSLGVDSSKPFPRYWVI